MLRDTAFLCLGVNLILYLTSANLDFEALHLRELHISLFIFISPEHHSVLYFTVLPRLHAPLDISVTSKLFGWFTRQAYTLFGILEQLGTLIYKNIDSEIRQIPSLKCKNTERN